MGTGLSITDFVKESIKGFYERLKTLKTFTFLKSDRTHKKCNLGDLADGYAPAKKIVSDSGRKTLVVFGNTKSVCNVTVSGSSTNFYFDINNFDENILRLYNSGSTDFDFIIGAVTCKGVNIPALVIPDTGLLLKPDGIAEISIMSDGNKTYVTFRDDFGEKTTVDSSY